MRTKVYQITFDKAYYKRMIEQLEKVVHAHSDYALSKNMNQWEDLISQSLADDLFDKYESLKDLLEDILKNAEEIQTDAS